MLLSHNPLNIYHNKKHKGSHNNANTTNFLDVFSILTKVDY